jgi:hypothetical protein
VTYSSPEAVSLNLPSNFTPVTHTKFLGVVPNIKLAPNANGVFNAPNDGYCAFLFTTPPGTCGNVTYNGGSLENQGVVQVIIDFWGGPGWTGCSSGLFDSAALDPLAVSPSDCKYMGLVSQYFVDMCADTVYTDLDQQYLFGSGFGPLCTKFAPTAPGVTNSFVDTRPFPELPLSDGDIQNEANAADTFEGFSSNGYNTMVMVFLPAPVGECQSGGNCFPTGNFCAYHQSTGSSLGSEIQYAVMPDVAKAGSGCINSNTSPNSDPWADAVINTASHEQQEAMTDPDGSAWYCSSACTGAGAGAEIGDECNYDFLGTEPDATTTHLGADGYRLQAEWSDLNNGCTRDIAGAPTQVTESILQDTSTGTTASPKNFAIHYEEAGQDSAASTLVKTCCSGSVTFFVTPSTVVLTVPSKGAQAWCFDSTCATQIQPIVGPVTLSYYYYQMVREQPFMKIFDGGTPPYFPTFSYTTAPPCSTLCNAFPDGVFPGAVKLSTTPSSVALFLVKGTKATVNSCIPVTISLGVQKCGSGNHERWDTGGPCATTQPFTCTTSLTASAPDSITRVDYWNQWLFTGSYSVVGGGTMCGSAPCYDRPTLTGTQFGLNYAAPLSTKATTHWLDATTSWSVTNPLGGSSATVRWDTTDASAGTMTSPVTRSLAFYHQDVLTLSYSVVGGGTPFSPFLTGTVWGTAGPIGSVSTTPLGYWLDAGSPWSVSNPLSGSTPTERWQSAGPTSGLVSAETLSFIYNHQFFVTFAASPIGDGTASPASNWFDAGATVSIGATAGAGFAFSTWTSSTAGIAIASANSASTTATINAAGIVTATFTVT